MKVSVILPTFNEKENIVPLIRSIQANIPSGWDHEIIVVDDNSPDGTCQFARDAFIDDTRVVAHLRTEDHGLAKSIRAGIDLASGDKIIIMDTDFTHDPVEIPRLVHVGMVYDIVSGSRFCPGGNMHDANHYLASFFYNILMRVILRTQVQDNLGGFFVIGRKELEILPKDEIFFGYGDYFFRLLSYAQAAGLTVVEIPAIYHSRRHGKSKSNFFLMLFSYMKATLALRRKLPKRRKQVLD